MTKFIKIKNFFESNFLTYIAIFSFLILAHFPVLTGDFLKQDDWNATFWSYGGAFFLPHGHPEFWNATIELFRPVGALILIISDYICINIENAKYVKFFTIILMSFASYLTYIWQVKFLPNDKFFPFCFAILSFCLFASQLHTSTSGYNGMVITLLCGQVAFIYFFKALMEVQKSSLKKKYILFSTLLILAGCMNYAITLMYYFLFLFIFYISNIDNNKYSNIQIYTFLVKSTLFIIALMILYILLAKFVHLILDIQQKMHGGYIRSIHINWDIMNKIYNVLIMIKYSFNVFNLWSSTGISNIIIFFNVALVTVFLFCTSIFIRLNLFRKKTKNSAFFSNNLISTIFIFIVSFALLILSYTPVLPLEVKVPNGNPLETIMTNRYFVITMPFILYIMMWSINTLGSLNFLSNLNFFFKKFIFSCLLFFGVYQCNYSLENYIVQPHLTELNYIKKHIENDFLKILDSGEKPKIIIIRNPSIREIHRGNDYDLTINYSHNWLISATIYTLRQYNIKTILTHKVLSWDNDLGIHIRSHWGELASVNNINTFNLPKEKNTVIIDMNKLIIKNK